MGTQVLYAADLPKIPSEYIEPYAQRFLMMQVEAIALGLITPQQGKDYLHGAEYFITTFAGLHAEYAVSNIYSKFMDLDNDRLLEVCKSTFQI